MKKFSLVFAGLMFSGMVSAATVLDASGQLTLVDCPGAAGVSPLLEDVTIALTAGVRAGFACNATQVVMSACHSNGRQTARSAVVNVPAGCSPTGTPCTGVATEQVTGPSFPTASSNGGTVVAEYPVASVTGGCTAANARSHAVTKLPAAPAP